MNAGSMLRGLAGRQSCLVLALLIPDPGPAGAAVGDEKSFLRGDVDDMGDLSVTDALGILSYLFHGNPSYPAPVDCLDAADVDDSGGIDITDAVYLLNFAFRGGPEPSAPFPSCGPDPTADVLDCAGDTFCDPTFYGIPVDADGLFFVVDRSAGMRDSGELDTAKREMIRNVMLLPEHSSFGMVFFDHTVIQFPASGQPAQATAEAKESAISFVMATLGGYGSCIREGLLAILGMANLASGMRAVFYVGDGGGTCQGQDEASYLAETLNAVKAENAQGLPIHVIGVGGISCLNDEFLKQLAEQSGGTYTRIDS